ncbi:hypothetical protein HW35_15530 [Bacillus sp. X1(2014)]|nr:hypothetical protein HW35_15530 [Bacillus sp. X1(2014)]
MSHFGAFFLIIVAIKYLAHALLFPIILELSSLITDVKNQTINETFSNWNRILNCMIHFGI